MQFYRANILMKHIEKENDGSRIHRGCGEKLSVFCDDYSRKILQDIGYMFVGDVTEYKTSIYFIMRKAVEISSVEDYIEDFIVFNKIEYSKIDIKEITFGELLRIVRTAERLNYIDNGESLLNDFKISDVNERRGMLDINESILNDESNYLFTKTV